jgi:hypothetical protein
MRSALDEAAGKHRDEPTAVQLLSYSGPGVPAVIGGKFRELTAAMGLEACNCPVVAATRRTGANALGHPQDTGVRDLSYRLAVAVSDFHFTFDLGGRGEALGEIHRIMLDLEGAMQGRTYHQHITETGEEPGSWRPRALAIAEELRFSPERFATADAWLGCARRLLEPLLPEGTDVSINQRLRRNANLAGALSAAAPNGHPVRTIHSVKGMEFLAVCVVMSPSTAKGIVDFLTGEGRDNDNEEARKIYVGAARAQRLLVIALPRTQAPRLRNLMLGMGGDVSLVAL